MDTLTTRLSRTAVWTGDGIELRDVEVPALGEGDILVRVRLATICGSDLHTVTGRRSAACPSVLGHEAVGVVEAIGGADADGGAGEGSPIVRVGDRIIWSVTVACGRCARCRAGRTAKCEAVRKIGHEAFDGHWPLSGSYAEYIVLPAGTAVASVPDSVPDAVAAPAACATATVMATLEAAGPLDRRRVLICGAGMLGITAAAACAESGAHVSITDLHPARIEIAHRFGGTADAGGAVDVVLDYSGSADAIAEGLARLDIGGVLVLAGSVAPGPALAVDPESVVRRHLTITGVHNYEPRHLRQAIDFLDRTREVFPWADVVSAPVELDELGHVLTSPRTDILRASVAP
ncbi:dehydrogenase [Rhodococcus sp. ABRD24]|uniref:zinc-binding dehydrogenase n=1 Tax=Rhodococcus sp. ABRD24 TaxID=2507582 RepID=UPI0010407B89|nr:zinc-binding dehydrogenase [Rhodococcus sp. ABRD24]QBJ94544.1 dehydrogenase [Rhodococcus sp. ABRD24]